MKSFLGGLLAVIGLSNRTASASSTAVQVANTDFPFPLFVVHGEKAQAEWERMRAEGNGYPVILGNDDALSMISEMLDFEEAPEVGAVLAKAETLEFPACIHQMRRKEEADYREQYPEDYAAEVAEGFHQEPVGEWPEVAPASPELTVHQDILTGQSYEKVYIALLPTTSGWQVPAYLSWGGWNENPGPEVHVAALKSWHERYGAELVGMDGATLNLRVSRRPRDRDEALALAREQYDYCRDIVDQGVDSLSNLAASLVEAKWWYFWWD